MPVYSHGRQLSWTLKAVNALPKRASGCLLAPEQVVGRGCSSGLSAQGLKCVTEQLKLDSLALAKALVVAELEPGCSGQRCKRLPEAGAGLHGGSCPGLGYAAESHARAQPGAVVETSCVTGW